MDYRSIPVAEAYTRAKEYARKALALDESVPSAHASLAWALFIYDWNWDEAEREFRRAIELTGDVDTGKIEAAFKNGVLTIDLPRTKEAQERVKQIPVKAA